MLYKIQVLGSSSSGCAYILYFDKTTIQLDAGIKNKDVDKIDTLFISHLTHRDHDKYISDFKNKEIILPKQNNHHGETISTKYDSFIVQHKVLNNGYVISCENEKIAYITDCGDSSNITQDMSDLTYLFIECNWDYFLINQKIIKAQPHAVYSFSSLGHMSNLDCLNAIANWNINKDCKIIFIHKSSQHANYETTYKLFESLPNKTIIAKKDKTIYTQSWQEI